MAYLLSERRLVVLPDIRPTMEELVQLVVDSEAEPCPSCGHPLWRVSEGTIKATILACPVALLARDPKTIRKTLATDLRRYRALGLVEAEGWRYLKDRNGDRPLPPGVTREVTRSWGLRSTRIPRRPYEWKTVIFMASTARGAIADREGLAGKIGREPVLGVDSQDFYGELFRHHSVEPEVFPPAAGRQPAATHLST